MAVMGVSVGAVLSSPPFSAAVCLYEDLRLYEGHALV